MSHRYFRAVGRLIHTDFASADWGPFEWVVEIDDQHASRQINVFEDGRVLRYDRDHWCDDFGMLLRGSFSRQPKWQKGFSKVVMISADEFEKLWRQALKSPHWPLQQAHSRKPKWGELKPLKNDAES